MSKETCCCGSFSVGKGSLFIGIFNIIGSIINLIIQPICIYSSINNPDKTKDEKIPDSVIILSGCVSIVILLLYFIFACLLVHGYRVRNHRLVSPWFIANYAWLILSALSIVAVFVLKVSSEEFAKGAVFIGVCLTYMGVETYLVFVVKRFADELKAEAECKIVQEKC
ncbi:uncharacterized protein LOC110859695 [Folsomia candida]|uniref:MARVEL domain-containing protein n=1 Tax=Folsomia candida TaxID=158441 RepID=A0A226DB53_FOLCA|nr:uncharacterized protein LOC110859695 [Folsomia candida]OXA42138.1 hypothetical protein Fcan01_23082 [Folsomia candida]